MSLHLRTQWRTAVRRRVSVAGEVWYHMAGVADTRLERLSPYGSFIHLGTLRAALDRADDAGAAERSFLYEVEIDPKNPVNSMADPMGDWAANDLNDFDANPGRYRWLRDIQHNPIGSYGVDIDFPGGDFFAWLKTKDAVYYTNAYEDPDSISVMVRPSAITSVTRVGQFDVREGLEWDTVHTAAQGTDLRDGTVAYQERAALYDNPYWDPGRSDITRLVKDLDLPLTLLRDPAMVDLVRGRGTGGGWRQRMEPGLKSSFEETKASIAADGLLNGIEVAVEPDGRLTIIDGTHRILAVHELGWRTIPLDDLRYFGGSERYWLYDHATPHPPEPFEPEVMW